MQLFGYLHPSTLYQLSSLSKTWRTIVKSDFMKPLWLDLLRGPPTPKTEFQDMKRVVVGYDDPEPIPSLNGDEVEPFRLATLLFDKTCEVRVRVGCVCRWLVDASFCRTANAARSTLATATSSAACATSAATSTSSQRRMSARARRTATCILQRSKSSRVRHVSHTTRLFASTR